jgi:sugar phosphate isomerase/epimerase
LAQGLKQALHTAARLGCDGVQIDAREELSQRELSDTGVRQLRKMLDDLNLRVGSAAFASRRGYAEAEDLERRIGATIDAMRLASRLGARVLVIGTGPVPPVEARERATLVEALTSLAGAGSRLGVELAAQCPEATPTEAKELLAQLPAGLLGLDLNPADVLRAGRSPREVVAAVGQHIVHVYANDATRALGSGVIDVELGRGSVEMPEVLGALEEFDYRGWVTIQRRNSTRPVEDCANAVAYLRSL